ncbi:MAG TPA: hypothetical protein VN872_00620 [Candidatus Acidoferrum sp.]|nr:hypothetical protein [Candidatus Acidoferrum sp.]
MRSAECQVAAVVALHHTRVAVSDPARLAGSGPQVPADSMRHPVDSDPVPAFVHLVRRRELTASQPLLHQAGHSRRGALCPGSTSS